MVISFFNSSFRMEKISLCASIFPIFFSFFDEIQQKEKTTPIIAEELIDLIKLMEKGNKMISQQKTKLFKDFLLKKFPSKPNQELISALREYLLVGFLKENLIQNQKDVSKIDHWIKKSLYIIHTLSQDPFYLQKNHV